VKFRDLLRRDKVADTLPGWAVNWDDAERRLEWYHNMSSVLQAGPCVRSNQLDYDEEVMYKVSHPNPPFGEPQALPLNYL
jgi:hypothetical protein